MAAENMDLYLYVQTPVHVGVAREKHLSGGIDYISKDGKIYLIDHKKLMKQVGTEQYIDALSRGKNGMDDLIKGRRLDITSITGQSFTITGAANDYKSMIKEGLSGKPYIPGSSIKGAIRSILFRFLFQESGESIYQIQSHTEGKNGRGRILPPDDYLLGKFENSFMRFIHCSDAYFDKLTLFNAKVFNLHQRAGSWEGGWKHQFRGGTTSRFSTSGFTTAFECLPIGAVTKFRLSFDRQIFERYRTHLKDEANRNDKKVKDLPYSTSSIFKEPSFRDVLFKIISEHTRLYLKQELEFFRKYPVQESLTIEAQFSQLAARNHPATPLFRLASGSGFHSITGNWRFDDHLSTIQRPDKIKTRRYKSRRLAFETIEDGELSFYPMGFVQMLTADHYERHLRPKIEAEKQAIQEKKRQQLVTQKRKQEEEQRRAEEARKPKMRTIAQVKKEKMIDGEVIGKKGMQVLIKPFVEGFENEVLQARYALGFPKGTIVVVKARLQGKKLVLQPPPKPKK